METAYSLVALGAAPQPRQAASAPDFVEPNLKQIANTVLLIL